jgi:DNA gyrase inhibitor GyrI
MELSVRQVPSIRVACVKHNGKLSELREAWERILGWAGRTGVLGRGPLVAITSEPPPAGGTCKYSVGVGVAKDVEVDDPIEVTTTQAGLFAVALVQGKEASVPDLYKKLSQDWIEKNGYERREGDCLEFRLNSSRQVSDGELLIEVCIPVNRVATEEPTDETKDRFAAMMRGEFEEDEILEDDAAEKEDGEEEGEEGEKEEGDEEEEKEAPARGRGAAKAAKAPKKATGKAGAEPADHATADKSAKGKKAPAKAKPEKAEAHAKKSNPAKPEKAEKPAKSAKAEKGAKAEKPAKAHKPAKASKPAKPAAKTKPKKK